jgi:hypothetical protein
MIISRTWLKEHSTIFKSFFQMVPLGGEIPLPVYLRADEILNMPDMEAVGDLDLEERICMMMFLTVQGFDFNIDAEVLDCDLTGIHDFSGIVRSIMGICRELRQVRPFAFDAFPGLAGNIAASMSKLCRSSQRPSVMRSATTSTT